MVSEPEVIASDILFPEGPVWCSDGTVVVTCVSEGTLYRIWPEEKRKELLVDVQGSANAAASTSDGGFIVTQSGGLDFASFGLGDHYPKPRHVSPGLQRVMPDGSVSFLVDGMQAPNDLVVGPDGTIFFTDPQHGSSKDLRAGRLMALDPDGTVRVVADQFKEINGIAREASGDLIVTEENGLMRVTPDGTKSWIVRNIGSDRLCTDGIALDVEGRIYAATCFDNGVRVIENGEVSEFWQFPGEGCSTNCCFGGPDNRWLIVTRGTPGDVVVFKDLPAPGLPLTLWPVPPQG